MLKFKEQTMFITQMNPANQVGGATVVIDNLTSAFDKKTFTICYLNYAKIFPAKEKKYENSFRLIPNYHIIHIASLINENYSLKFAVSRAKKIVKEKNIKCIIGVYPTYKSLKIAHEVANSCNLKFIPYLHDMISETLLHTKLKEKAISLEKKIFSGSYKVLVMSRGMKEYYKKKINIETYPLEHSFPEQSIEKINYERDSTIFWGGAIQTFNKNGFKRISNAAYQNDFELEVTNLQTAAGLVSKSKLVNNFYPERDDYINALTKKGVLTLAIDWPDESVVDEGELSTIFPTRIIEYLATGSPILAHCPKHYFLAKFIIEQNCGIVISDRNDKSLIDGFNILLSKSISVKDMQKNAIKAAKYFSLDKISNKLLEYLK